MHNNEPSFLYPLDGRRSRFPVHHRLLLKLNLFVLSITRNLAFVCPIDLECWCPSMNVSSRGQHSTCLGEGFLRSSILPSTCCKAIHVSLYNHCRPIKEVVHPYSLLQQLSHVNKTSICKNSQASSLYVLFRFGHCEWSTVGSPLCCGAPPRSFWKMFIDITVFFRVLCYLNANPMFMLDRKPFDKGRKVYARIYPNLISNEDHDGMILQRIDSTFEVPTETEVFLVNLFSWISGRVSTVDHFSDSVRNLSTSTAFSFCLGCFDDRTRVEARNAFLFWRSITLSPRSRVTLARTSDRTKSHLPTDLTNFGVNKLHAYD
jgi:hypothetical protein